MTAMLMTRPKIRERAFWLGNEKYGVEEGTSFYLPERNSEVKRSHRFSFCYEEHENMERRVYVVGIHGSSRAAASIL